MATGHRQRLGLKRDTARQPADSAVGSGPNAAVPASARHYKRRPTGRVRVCWPTSVQMHAGRRRSQHRGVLLENELDGASRLGLIQALGRQSAGTQARARNRRQRIEGPDDGAASEGEFLGAVPPGQAPTPIGDAAGPQPRATRRRRAPRWATPEPPSAGRQAETIKIATVSGDRSRSISQQGHHDQRQHVPAREQVGEVRDADRAHQLVAEADRRGRARRSTSRRDGDLSLESREDGRVMAARPRSSRPPGSSA